MIELTEAEIAMVLRRRESQAALSAKRASDAEYEARRDPLIDPKPGDSLVVTDAGAWGRQRYTVTWRRDQGKIHVQTPHITPYVCAARWTIAEWRRNAKAPGADLQKRAAP